MSEASSTALIPFVGRAQELEVLTRELGRSLRMSDTGRLICVTGPPGVGKSRLLHELASRFRQVARPVIWVLPPVGASMTDDAMEPEGPLVPTLEASLPRLQEALAAFARTYRYQSSHAFIQQLVDFFRHPERSGDVPPQYLVVLEDYERISPLQVEWVRRHLLRPLQSGTMEADCRVILCTQETPNELLQRHPELKLNTSPLEVALAPFSSAEIEELAQGLGLSAEEINPLLARGGGIVGRILLAWKEEATRQRERLWVERTNALVAPMSPDEREWLVGAAHLRVANLDALTRLEMPAPDRGIVWMLSRPDLFRSQGEGMVLDEDWAEAVRTWMRATDPTGQRQLQARTDPLNHFIELVPVDLHRRHLQKLSIFNFFNPEVLREIYPLEHEELREFSEAHEGYFLRTERNQQMAPHLLKVVVASRPPPPEEVLQKLQACWDRHRETMVSTLRQSEQQMDEAQRQLNRITTELKQIQSQIGDAPKPSTRAARAPAVAKAGGGSGSLMSILCELGGVVLLYFSILFSHSWSFLYGVIGLASIGLGLYWPKHRSRPTTANANRAGTGSSPQRAEAPARTVPRYLQLRQTSLEHQRSHVAQRIARFQAKIQEIDAALLEAYVA